MEATVHIANLVLHIVCNKESLFPGGAVNVTQTSRRFPTTLVSSNLDVIIHANELYIRVPQGLMVYLLAVGFALIYTTKILFLSKGFSNICFSAS
jgi:hypothetical protein